LVAIETLKAGDKVIGRKENDPFGPLQAFVVEKVFQRTTYHLRILTLRMSDGQVQTIYTTDEHPAYESETLWTPAGELQVGDQLMEGSGGMGTVVATRYEAHPEGMEVFTLRVANAHTYLVRADGFDGEPIWVHNSCINLDDDEVNSDLVRQWASQFETRPAQGSGESLEFQVETSGRTEIHFEGGGEEVWGDGINYEEALLQEAKYASNPYNSPAVPGSAAGESAQGGYLRNLQDQLERYAAIVQDPNNPIRGLQMLTNNNDTAALLQEQMAAAGIPGRVDVVPFGRFSPTGLPI
jgi:hypothetical protein